MSDCEIPDFYSHNEPVARKAHSCCECRAPIEKGEKHFQVTMKYEGEIDRFRQHLDCMYACMEVRDYQDECVYYSGLKEWWKEFRQECVNDKMDGLKNFRVLFAKILRRERAHERHRRVEETAGIR